MFYQVAWHSHSSKWLQCPKAHHPTSRGSSWCQGISSMVLTYGWLHFFGYTNTFFTYDFYTCFAPKSSSSQQKVKGWKLKCWIRGGPMKLHLLQPLGVLSPKPKLPRAEISPSQLPKRSKRTPKSKRQDLLHPFFQPGMQSLHFDCCFFSTSKSNPQPPLFFCDPSVSPQTDVIMSHQVTKLTWLRNCLPAGVWSIQKTPPTKLYSVA